MKFIDINTNDLFCLLGETNLYLSQSVEWDNVSDEIEPMRNYRFEDENLWDDVEMSFRDDEDEDEDDDDYQDENDEDEDDENDD